MISTHLATPCLRGEDSRYGLRPILEKLWGLFSLRVHLVQHSDIRKALNICYTRQLDNIVFIQLVGLALIGVGIWQVVLDNNIERVVTEVNGKIIAGLFIGSGGGLTIISIFGVIGTLFKSRFMLSTVKLRSVVISALLLIVLCSTQ